MPCVEGWSRVGRYGEDPDRELYGQVGVPIAALENIKIRLEEMDNSKSIDLGLPWILFNEDIYRVAPSGDRDSALDRDIQKFDET